MSANPMIIRELLLTIDPVELEGKIRAKHEKGLIDHLFMRGWMTALLARQHAESTSF
jgi:hypothetical protein